MRRRPLGPRPLSLVAVPGIGRRGCPCELQQSGLVGGRRGKSGQLGKVGGRLPAGSIPFRMRREARPVVQATCQGPARSSFSGDGHRRPSNGVEIEARHPLLESFPVVIRFPVHWGDQDAFGHVNNTVPLRWFESARIALFGDRPVRRSRRNSGSGRSWRRLRATTAARSTSPTRSRSAFASRGSAGPASGSSTRSSRAAERGRRRGNVDDRRLRLRGTEAAPRPGIDPPGHRSPRRRRDRMTAGTTGIPARPCMPRSRSRRSRRPPDRNLPFAQGDEPDPGARSVRRRGREAGRSAAREPVPARLGARDRSSRAAAGIRACPRAFRSTCCRTS